jgi:hypothetical protein
MSQFCDHRIQQLVAKVPVGPLPRGIRIPTIKAMGLSGKAVDVALAELAAKNSGLIRAVDLETKGIARSVVVDRTKIGLLTPLQPHVWLFGQSEPSFEQECRAAVWTGDGVLGGPAALVWHGALREPAPDLQPTVVVDRSTRPTVRNAKLIRSNGFVSGDRCVRDGLCLTSIPRSLIDSATQLTPTELERALDDALIANKTTAKALKARVDLAASSRGIRCLRTLVEDRIVTGQLTRSQAEQRVRGLVLSCDVPKPEFLHRIRTSAGRVFELDIAWPEHRVALEIDGFRWHGGRMSWRNDLQRDRLITLEGWNVKRIIPEITHSDLAALLAVLLPTSMG